MKNSRHNFLPGRSSAQNGHASVGFGAQFLQVFPLIAQQFAHKIVAGKMPGRDYDFVGNLDSALVVDIDVFGVGWGPLHHRLLGQFVDLVFDEAGHLGHDFPIDLTQFIF